MIDLKCGFCFPTVEILFYLKQMIVLNLYPYLNFSLIIYFLLEHVKVHKKVKRIHSSTDLVL